MMLCRVYQKLYIMRSAKSFDSGFEDINPIPLARYPYTWRTDKFSIVHVLVSSDFYALWWPERIAAL